MFEPDNHIADIPIFRACEREYAKNLIDACEKSLGVKLGHKLEQIHGADINSLNFKSGHYLIKLLDDNEGKESQDFMIEIKKNMSYLEIPHSKSFAECEHTSIVINGKKHSVLIEEFIEGSFFSGSVEELSSFVNCLNKLRKLKVASARASNPYAKYSVLEMRGRLGRINIDSKDIIMRDLFLQYLEFSQTLIDREKSLLIELGKYTGELNHFDLHPHNVLYKNNEVAAIVDLQSFVQVPYELSRSFGLFKHIRKMLVKDDKLIANVRKDFLSHESDIKKYAKVELIRRLTVIFYFYFFENKNDWIQDIKKHMRALSELDYIFSK